jgi:hypothetical protein
MTDGAGMNSTWPAEQGAISSHIDDIFADLDQLLPTRLAAPKFSGLRCHRLVSRTR